MNRLLTSFLLIAALASPLVANSVSVGMAETDLLQLKGTPESKAKLGKKAIYRWPDAQVILVDGKVESFKLRDVAAEKAAANERARAERLRKSEAAAQARANVQNSREEKVYNRLDTAATTREKEARLLRAASISQQIRSIEQQLSEDDKRSSFKGPPPMSAEGRAFLNLRLDNLRTELANLR